ncbi:acetyl-CoA acetyltransferase [Breoghania corrubedonensis]|uniref:Acetyl-CoA acetyltransferase n=1 Tax=Breoghania corrubedonensis TaxID=665038 RepID=A0A2T5UYR4_9HYPH|nr:thiolase family protein [Breoghania corrubedonensis]PTW56611.1 acetyl-CoA acetyltransferase [Breoghania corrubedonensis]
MTRIRPNPRRPYENVAVAVPVSIPYVRYSVESAHWWIARALSELTKRAGIRPADIDGLSVSSFTLSPDTAVGLTQHLGLSPRWLDNIPMGGASGVVALRRAARAVEAGDATIVACVGGDANQVDSFRKLLSSFSRFAQDASYPYGYGGPNGSFALLTDHYMRSFGARREDFGRICVDQRTNALGYPHAIMKKPLTMEDYLGARAIADPIHLFDCVMPCAGSEAFLVTTLDIAKDLGLPHARLASTIERHNAFVDDPIQMRGGWAVDVDELYAMAGMKPDDIDLVETYDDYPVIVMMQFEDLGFCKKGEGPDFVRSHSFTNDGNFPQNTSGGQLSAGQAGAGGGYLGLVEALRQVTHTALSKQVPDARTALVSGFGMINYDRGLCSGAAILEGVAP